MNKRIAVVVLLFVFTAGLLAGRYLHWPWPHTQVLLQQNPFFESRYGLFERFPRPADVVMLGDSLTEMAEWSDLFPDIRISNRGIASDTTAGALSRVGQINAAKPQKVFILIGANDLIAKRPHDETASNYAALVKALGAPRIYAQSVLLVSPSLGLQESISRLNATVRAVCLPPCVYLDLNGALHPNGYDPAMTTDGLHLSAEAYVRWQKFIAPYVIASPN